MKKLFWKDWILYLFVSLHTSIFIRFWRCIRKYFSGQKPSAGLAESEKLLESKSIFLDLRNLRLKYMYKSISLSVKIENPVYTRNLMLNSTIPKKPLSQNCNKSIMNKWKLSHAFFSEYTPKQVFSYFNLISIYIDFYWINNDAILVIPLGKVPVMLSWTCFLFSEDPSLFYESQKKYGDQIEQLMLYVCILGAWMS